MQQPELDLVMVPTDGHFVPYDSKSLNQPTAKTNGRIFVRALRTIKPHEELTYDYGEEYFDKHIKPHGCCCNKCAV